MPFDPDLSSPLNPYKRGEGVGLALARFLQVLANFFKLDAHYRVPGTLCYLQKHLVSAKMLSKLNFYTFVSMPCDPYSSSARNIYKKGEKAGPALDRFPQVLANFFKFNALYRVPGTLS